MSLEPAPISLAHRQIATVTLIAASRYPPAARWRWQLRGAAILNSTLTTAPQSTNRRLANSNRIFQSAQSLAIFFERPLDARDRAAYRLVTFC